MCHACAFDGPENLTVVQQGRTRYDRRRFVPVLLIGLLILWPPGCDDGTNDPTGGEENPVLNEICGAAPGQLFGADYPWNQTVDHAPLDDESSAIIDFLQAGHTGSQRFRIDGPSEERNSLYGLTIQYADATTPRRSLDSGLYSPDCDTAPVPMPDGGALEGEASYACDGDGDCHLVVVESQECRLYEVWRADDGSNGISGCLAVWDLTAAYDPVLRGDCCTSADAAGLPIAAHTFTADEVAAGEIKHAIRFVLPNSLIRERIYVRPATHSTPATSGPGDAPPYGARLRLSADFDTSRLNAAARVVAVALQRYGMILSDGGNLTFTAANDRFTEHKWVDVGLGPDDLTPLEWTDFEVVELGPRYRWDNNCDCQRTAITN